MSGTYQLLNKMESSQESLEATIMRKIASLRFGNQRSSSLFFFYNIAVIVLFFCVFSFNVVVIFPAQKDFQGEDAMWLHHKATQKKQCAAAII